VGGGFQLDSCQTSSINVPAGTSADRIWGRTGCSFNGGRGSCRTGDCAGALTCSLSGQRPATLAEYTIGGGGANDFYDVSVIDGYNLLTDFSCSTCIALRCRGFNYPDAYHHPNDIATYGCSENNNYMRVCIWASFGAHWRSVTSTFVRSEQATG
jgi:hypothetical protein